MSRMSFTQLHVFYHEQLFNTILPFWMKRGIDREHGGFHNCFTNRGDRLLYRHKFTWSQGRFVWLLARLARTFQGRLPQAQLDDYRQAAVAGAEFLLRHARLPNGNCAFILSDAGEPILLHPDGTARQAEPGESYDTSIYADSFVIYGMAECAMATNKRKYYDYALDLYDSMVRRFYAGPYRSDPYPVPTGYESHGRPMGLLETANGLAQAAAFFGDPREAALLVQAEGWMAEILDKFRDPSDLLIAEMWSADPARRATRMGRYINPGHTIEDMWFILHLAKRLDRRDRIAQAVQTLLATCRIGWDNDFGGFPQYLHRTGGAPRGDVPPELAGHEMIRKLRSNWDNKLWWPHSEALYSLLLGYEHTRNPELLDWYWKVHDYTFATFPNPDASIGEWIQIRTRDGRPDDKVVALPVKDPFHITRSFLLCLDLLERLA
jgi:N-acylglucosamine 2-epimerase